MDLGLRDRTYIVTGASAGLGFATAKALAADGARLVISSRNEESIARAAAELGENVVGIPVDNADPESAERLAATAIAKWGALHGALISVGGPRPGHGARHRRGGLAGGVRQRLPRRPADRPLGRPGGFGRYVDRLRPVVVGEVPDPRPGISNGLRPGLAMVAKTLADELGPNGTRVNGLLPGRISTDRLKELDAKGGDPEAARRAAEKTIPLRRYGDPDEFGRVAAFVLSPAASYITGAMIPIDGGALRSL